MKKIFLASIIANIILFQLWQFEKGKRIEQQAAFSATEEERRVKNEKSICTEKKIAVLRKKEAKPQNKDCDCLNTALPDDVIKWLRE